MNVSCENCKEYKFETVNVVFLVVYSVLTIFICGGNLLTIVAICKTEVLRTISNIYVATLAFADLIAGLVLPLQMLFEFPEGRALLDTQKDLCLWRNVTFFVSINLSLVSILAIAFDRALFIGRPFWYERFASYKLAGAAVCFCLFISIVDGTVCLYDNKWVPGGECRAENILSEEFRIYGQIIPITLCFGLAGCCYGYIFHIAKKHQTNIRKNQCQATVNDIQIIKVLFLVFGIFLICWSPVTICIVIARFNPVPQIFFDIFTPLVVLNSGMNFIVYAVKNKDFRKAFKDILCYNCAQRQHTQVVPLNTNRI